MLVVVVVRFVGTSITPLNSPSDLFIFFLLKQNSFSHNSSCVQLDWHVPSLSQMERKKEVTP